MTTRLITTALIAATLWSQVYYATLVGTLRDASGAIVSDAEIAVTEVNTGVVATARTDSTGEYRLTTLRPGSYTVRVTAAGFSEKTVSGVDLFVGKSTRVDISLEVGALAERVSVSAAAPLIQTETAERGGIMEGVEVRALPLNTRDFQQLTYLMPGVVVGSDYVGSISANGMSVTSNMFYVDGGSLTSMKFGNAVERINLDTIEEFKMETSNFTADRGLKAGSAILIATKHGTNELHGTLFEYLRNDKLNARTFFASGVPPLRYNQFGATVGGPIKRDKLFFQGSFEASRQRSAQTLVGTVPTAAERQGDFTQGTGSKDATVFDPLNVDANTGLRLPFPNNIIPQSRWNPIASKYQSLWPQPQNAGFPNFRYNAPAKSDYTVYSARIDYNISAKDTLYFRLGYQSNPFFNPPALPNAGGGTTGDSTSGRDFVVSWTRVLSPRSLNELRFSFANIQNSSYPAGFYGQNLAKQWGFSNGDGLIQALWGCPGIGVTPFTSPCPLSYSDLEPNKNFFLSDDFSFRRGSHNFKTGFLAYRWYNDLVFGVIGGSYTSFTGYFTSQIGDLAGGQPFGDLLLGALGSVRVNENVELSPDRKNDYQYYFMDDWRVNSKLTLQLGMRYDMNLPATIANGQAAAWVEGLGQRTGQVAVFPANAKWPLDQALRGTPLGFPYRFADNNWLNKPNWRNVQPRIGIAYRPFGDAKTVIRGGYGMYYDAAPTNFYGTKNYGRPFYVAGNTPPRPTLFEPPPYQLGRVPFITPGFQPGEPFNSGYTSGANWPDTRYQQWNLTVQREVSQDISLEVGYVGNHDSDGLWYHAWNRVYPVGYTFRYDDGSTFTIQNDTPLLQRSKYPQLLNNYGGLFTGFHGMYNALQLHVVKRMSHGLSLRAGYTRSRSYGVDGADRLQDEYNYKDLNFTRLNDRPNVFFATYVWQLPGHNMKGAMGALMGGWQFAGLARLESGAPFDVWESQVSYPGAANEKATLISGRNPQLSSSQRSVAEWFDVTAFARPADNQFGNAIGLVRAAPTGNLDVALSKVFRVTERHRLEFRTEAFNLPNHAKFGTPGVNRGTATFGKITSAGPGRQLQFGLKYQF